MSYVPQATYGGYPGAATHSPYLDEKTIKQQETDATAALEGQASMQTKMLDHQYSHQKEMITAECTRNITMAENQFKQQRDQSLMALAKQQRLMAITQQAAQMTAQAQQYKLQMDMQKKMATLYSRVSRSPRGFRRLRLHDWLPACAVFECF